MWGPFSNSAMSILRLETHLFKYPDCAANPNPSTCCVHLASIAPACRNHTSNIAAAYKSVCAWHVEGMPMVCPAYACRVFWDLTCSKTGITLTLTCVAHSANISLTWQNHRLDIAPTYLAHRICMGNGCTCYVGQMYDKCRAYDHAMYGMSRRKRRIVAQL